MTSDMAFECLLVSRDPELFGVIAAILRSLSISLEVCLRDSKALEILRRGSTDLVVLDWEGEGSSELLEKIWREHKSKKPTIVAISSTATLKPGAHIVIKKPITKEAGIKPFRAAYERMLFDYRRCVRYPLMIPVLATTGHGYEISVTLTDIGDGGVGLCSREKLVPGDVLSFRVVLPGASREILLHARILWAREYDRLGCEFVRIPPVDLMILHDWLEAKVHIKKPRIEV